jgi:hypothetical protein
MLSFAPVSRARIENPASSDQYRGSFMSEENFTNSEVPKV